MTPRKIEQRRYDSTNPLMVGLLEFTNLEDAIDAAMAASKLQENAFSAQICQALQKGFAGYQGSSRVVAHFKNGIDLLELAADEDGEPDLDLRAQALRPRMKG